LATNEENRNAARLAEANKIAEASEIVMRQAIEDAQHTNKLYGIEDAVRGYLRTLITENRRLVHDLELVAQGVSAAIDES
jgi:hypothetical protein